jgi:PAS domain S-box-containing protein
MGQLLRIMLVDSSDRDAAHVMSVIDAAGLQAQFTHVRDRAAFLEQLPRQSWDLLLCECRIDDLSAQELIALLRRRELSIPVIVVCRGVGEALAVSVMHAGAHDFVSKQDLSRLVPAIERELAEQAVHRRADRILRETEQRFRQLSDNIQGVFWMLDAQAEQTLYLSPSFEEVWERPAQLMLASPRFLLSTIHPEDLGSIQQILDEQGWTALNHDYRIVLADGSERWIHTRCFAVPDEPGERPRIAGISADITAQKQLAQEKEMMARALEQSADAVMITDVQGQIIYVNQAFEDLSGYAKEEVLGQRPSLLRSGFQDEEFYRKVWQSLSIGLPFTDVFINRRKDGELYYEAKTITPLRGEGGEISHYVSTGKDITERLKVRERLQRLMHYDAVTGLASRILLQDRLQQAVLQSRRLQTRLGVVCVGLGLSELLDGSARRELHEGMMRTAAQRLLDALDTGTTVARLNSDEFVILLKNVEQDEQLDEVMQGLMLAFAEPLCTDDYELFLSPTAGISFCPEHSIDADELLNRAELAMRHARQHSGCNYSYYRKEMNLAERRAAN